MVFAQAQIFTMIRSLRALSTAPVARQTSKFHSPKQYVAQQKIKAVQEQAYKQSLLQEEGQYDPKYLSENKVDPATNRPVPLNVELLKYKPIRVPKTHGHEVSRLVFKSYSEEGLVRASEFAARAAFYLGIPCDPVKKLKTEKRLYTVIRSPFAQAKSKENFHRVTFQAELKAYDATSDVVELWLSFINKHKIDNVDYSATVHAQESLDFSTKLDAVSPADLKLPEAYGELDDEVAAKVNELLKSDTFKDLMK